MLSLLAPAALAGAALLAIPVAIHLFKPRKVRVTSFSSLRWLNLSKQKLARRIQWHQLLLFFVRAAFILMLVFALARPLFTPGGETAGVDRFVVLDVSRSMGYQPAAPESENADVQETPLDRAKTVAANLLTQSRPDDRVALLLTANRSRAAGPLIRDGQAYQKQLNDLTATQGQTDLSSALQTITPMLPAAKDNRAVELYFLTDNHLQSWNQGVITKFMQDAKRPVIASIVDVSSPNAQNAYIAEVQRVFVAPTANGANPGQKLRVSLGYAGIGKTSRTLRLDAVEGVPVQSQTINLEADQTQWVEFVLPAGFEAKDQIARISLDPADGLPTDDVAYIHLDTQGAIELLLIDGGAAQGPENKDALHLRAAVQALAIASQGNLVVSRRAPTRLTTPEIANAQVIILANVSSLTTDQLDALRQRVQMGAGVAIFLGPSADMNFYNNGLFNSIDAKNSLIPWKLGTLKRASLMQGELPRMTDVNWSHPLLESLYDPILGDLPQTRFFNYFQIQETDAANADNTANADGPTNTAAATATVLARIGGQTPAIIEQPMGAGKVLLLNLTADDTWSDLPRRKSYVPLIDQLITYLAGGQAQRSFEVLTPITMMLPQSQATIEAAAQVPASDTNNAASGSSASAATLPAYTAQDAHNPQGTSYSAITQQVGVRTLVRFDGVAMPGVYNVLDAKGKTVTTFVAYAGSRDSRISSVDTQMIREWWEPAALTVQTPRDAIADIRGKTATVKLWPWLIALGGLLLATEMFLVHRLCPRMNPTLATSVIETHKGIVAPREPAASRSTA